jgi:hypothetical protein
MSRITSFGKSGTSVARATLTAAALALITGSASAALYGVQPATGLIVNVDPATGAIVSSYAAPGTLGSTNTLIGLSGAEGGNVLIYRNDNSNVGVLYRLDPLTGSVLTTQTTAGYSTDGLSFENISGTNYIYSNHSSTDLHRQTGYNGTESFFFTSGAPVGGLGGDGFGRGFANYTDGTVKEFNLSTGAIVNSFSAPISGIQGLAYDGSFLYASNGSGTLATVNPNTGAVISSVSVSGGSLFGLGSTGLVPEPTSACIMLLGAGALSLRRRRRA